MSTCSSRHAVAGVPKAVRLWQNPKRGRFVDAKVRMIHL
jgi:hypothetical protein